MSADHFATRIAALVAKLGSSRQQAVQRLRSEHEAWARALLGGDPNGGLLAIVRAAVAVGITPESARRAIEQLHQAEEYQWEIGTWSTGSGEGLASMFEVRTLQVARAWLWTLVESEGRAGCNAARELLDEVRADPNGMALRLEEPIAALERRLEAQSPGTTLTR